LRIINGLEANLALRPRSTTLQIICKSFNVWILDASYLPALDLVDKLRKQLMEKKNNRRRLAYKIRMQLIEKKNQRRQLAYKWEVTLMPLADTHVKDISNNLGGWAVRISNDAYAEVENDNERHVLDMSKRICACRR